VLAGELTSLYQGQPLRPLSFQYKDYALWQRSYLSGSVLEGQLSYWRGLLSGYPTLGLVTDKVRPAQVSYAGSELYFELDQGLSDGLRQQAQLLNVSLYSLLLSGYYLLLRAYSGQDDLVVGTPVANRHHAGSQELIGFFVNMLALRHQVDGELGLHAFISGVGKLVQEGLSHQDLPFERLVESLGVAPDSSRHAVFQVVFGLQGFFGRPSSEVSELFVPYQPQDMEVAAKFDLSLHMDDSGPELVGTFNYATSLFEQGTVQGYMDTYKHILSVIAASNPSQKVKSLCYLDDQAYRRQVYNWNQTTAPYPDTATIHGLFEQQVARTPDAVAVVYQGTRITYRELNERSNRLAHYLRGRYQVRADDLVCLCLDRSEHMLVSILAVLKAGGAYVPLDPASPSERTKYQLADTGARVVLASQAHAGKLRGLTAGIDVFSVDSPESDDLLESYPSNNPQAVSGAGDLAYVIYTSGTTGRPKGVMVQHQGVVNLAIHFIRVHGLEHDANIGCYSNYVFDAFVYEAFPVLLNGNQLFLYDEHLRKSLDDLSSYIHAHGIAVTFLPPALLPEFVKTDTPNLSLVFSGGEALPAIDQGSLGFELLNEYGPTEVTVCATLHPCKAGSILNNIGRPIANTSCYVLDKNLNPLPVGAIGELYIGGAGVARGYLNNDTLTRERFIANPFQTELEKDQGYNGRLYKTGDLVRYLVDGNLQYLGRNDFQVKIRGYRIEPGEIESRLCGYEGVRQALVTVKGGAHQYLAGYYVSSRELDQADIKAYLAAHLPEYMVPQLLVHLSAFPLTVNGKVDRAALPEGVFSSASQFVPPQTALQKQLCAIYGEVLGLDPAAIGIDDDFFGLGGTSLSSIRLVTAINRELHAHMKAADLFIAKSVRNLSRTIQSTYAKDRHITKLNDATVTENMFMIHPAWGGSEVYTSLATKLSTRYRCFGVESYNLHHDEKVTDLATLASQYLKYIEEVQGPVDPAENTSFTLLGYSLGGKIALEIAAALEAKGIKNIKLYLLDSFITDESSTELSDEVQLKELIEGGREMYANLENYEDRVIDFFNAQKQLSAMPISAKLSHTQIILFKAMLKPTGAIGQDGRSGNELKYNKVDLVVKNLNQLSVVQMHDVDHANLLNDEETLLGCILGDFSSQSSGN
jgi:amino acid adenylation domain-containing protein